MTGVNKQSHDFTCQPHVHLQVEQATPVLVHGLTHTLHPLLIRRGYGDKVNLGGW